MIKKSKFDKTFAREQLEKVTIRSNLSVYSELRDNVEDIRGKSLTKIQNRIEKNTDKRFKEADDLNRRYEIIRAKFDKLRAGQLKRRNKQFEWCKNYISLLEAKEIKLFKEKYCIGLEMPCLNELLFDEEYSDEQLLFLDEVEPAYKQVVEDVVEEETEEVDETPEEVEDEATEEENEEEAEEPEPDEEPEQETKGTEEPSEPEKESGEVEKAEQKKEEPAKSEREEKSEQSVAHKVNSILLAKAKG